MIDFLHSTKHSTNLKMKDDPPQQLQCLLPMTVHYGSRVHSTTLHVYAVLLEGFQRHIRVVDLLQSTDGWYSQLVGQSPVLGEEFHNTPVKINSEEKNGLLFLCNLWYDVQPGRSYDSYILIQTLPKF